MKDTRTELSIDELAQLLDISTDLVNRWMLKGLPRIKKGRKVFFNRVKVAEWLRDMPRLAKYMIRLLPKQSIAIVPVAGDTVEQFTTMLARAREVEQSSFKAWQTCEPCLRGVMEEQYMKSADQLRKAEKDWPSIQIAAGDALPKSMVESNLSKILTVLKQNILSVGQSVAVLLTGKTPAESRAIIDSKLQDALRECAGEFEKMK